MFIIAHAINSSMDVNTGEPGVLRLTSVRMTATATEPTTLSIIQSKQRRFRAFSRYNSIDCTTVVY
jgi:hypothetical protein